MERRGEYTEVHKQILPRDDKVHPVKIAKDSILYEITGSTEYQVNSLHHQAVKKPAESLRVTARCPDGIVEAMEYRGRRFILGVQWHPELMFHNEDVSQRLFRAFVQACQEK